MAEQVQVIGVGSPLVDILAHVSEEFVAGIKGAKGGMELVNDEAMAELVGNLPEPPVKAPGGSAANTVLALARLGLSTTLLGKLGRDDLGGFYQANCAAAGVLAPRFKYDDGLPTGQCLCLVTPDSGRLQGRYARSHRRVHAVQPRTDHQNPRKRQGRRLHRQP